MLPLLIQMLGVVILIYVAQMYFTVKGRSGILFGCTVSKEQKVNEFSGLIKSYNLVSSIMFIVCILSLLIAFFMSKYNVVIPVSTVYIVLTFILSIVYNRKTANMKVNLITESKEYLSKKQVSIADLSVKKITIINILTHIIVGIIFIGINLYAFIKGGKQEFESLGTLAVTTLFIYILYVICDIALRKVGLKIDPTNPEDSMIQNEKARELIGTLNLLVFIPEFIVITLINLSMIGFISINILWAVTIGQIITIVFAVILSKKVSKVRNNYKEKNTDVRWKDDDSNWKLGIIYYNKNNPHTFVEKRSGVGITVNAGSKGGMIFYIIILVLILVAIIPIPIISSI